jgi:hypothetical protein
MDTFTPGSGTISRLIALPGTTNETARGRRSQPQNSRHSQEGREIAEQTTLQQGEDREEGKGEEMSSAAGRRWP